ncbi:MAG: hypothetical protein CMG71_02965 [Candidatus Marinimicrobia bacterium]|nr:hypothetical protein [Candidatus Neomarinimicrobiota bacterium]|tara:strand:+ start:462 stop:851 length:390 start_codon:yes stop_codon:yes gene_type:complete
MKDHANIKIRRDKMKRYTWGILTGALVAICLTVVTTASTPQADSIKVYMSQLEQFLRGEMSKSTTAGRFQLQSFNIDRTHWHYMMDTATGKLYRMELGRTPDRSEWTLMAQGLIEEPPPSEEETETVKQ